MAEHDVARRIPIGQLVRYYLRLGLVGFGGPVALVGRMERELGRIAIGDWLTALVALAGVVVLFQWKVSNPLLIAVAAAIGLVAYPLLGPTWVFVK